MTPVYLQSMCNPPTIKKIRQIMFLEVFIFNSYDIATSTGQNDPRGLWRFLPSVIACVPS
jgi:hypothetical protein